MDARVDLYDLARVQSLARCSSSNVSSMRLRIAIM